MELVFRVCVLISSLVHIFIAALPEKSEGYLQVFLDGGLNQQRMGVGVNRAFFFSIKFCVLASACTLS